MTDYNCSCTAPWPRDTLKNLRRRMMMRLGYGGSLARPAPGKADEINDYLMEAQRMCYRDYAAFRGERWFFWTMTAGERFYDFDNSDGAQRIQPPVISDIGDDGSDGLLVPGKTYYWRITATNDNGETNGSVEFSYTAGDGITSAFLEWTLPDVPDGVPDITSQSLYRGDSSGNETLVKILASDDVSTVDEGDVVSSATAPPYNTTGVCDKILQPEKIRWVGTLDNGVWTKLIKGFNPLQFNNPVSNGWPLYYNVRGCIEVWPAPQSGTMQLAILGNFDLLPFTEDNHYTTIDSDVVFCRAMANAKANRGDQDAGNYRDQEVLILQNIVKASHGTARYIPQANLRGQVCPPETLFVTMIVEEIAP